MSGTKREPLHIWVKLKGAFNSIADLQFKEGLVSITKAGGEGIAASLNFAGGYELFNILKNPNLKPHQKIFPSIGYGLSIIVGIPAVVALIASSAVLLPPFVFAASVVCVIRNIGIYLEDRAERNNLRKELVTAHNLVAKLEKENLPDDKKTQVYNSILGQRHIYLDLYALRNAIITETFEDKQKMVDSITVGKIPFEDKQKMVDSVNEAIEKFSRGEVKQLDFDTQYFPQKIKDVLIGELAKINIQLNNYENDCRAVKQMDLPKSLAKSIESYKFSQENIYSQDLPLDIKREMVSMLEGKKVNKRDLNDLYLRVGQHYLNNTSIDQLKIQDDNRKMMLMTYVDNESDLNNCVQFYQKPRDVYVALDALQTSISHQDFGSDRLQDQAKLLADVNGFIAAFKSGIAIGAESDSGISEHMSEHLLKQFEDKFGNEGPPIAYAVNNVVTELRAFNIIVNQFQQSPLILAQQGLLKKLPTLTEKGKKQLAEMNVLITSVKQHQLNSLEQFSSQFGQQFRAPNIQNNHNKYDLLAKAASKIDEKTNLSGKLNRIGKSAKTRSLKRLFGVSNDQSDQKNIKTKLSQEESQMQEEFKDRYNNTFTLMEKKERLNYLEKSVPRRLANVGIASVVALASLATTFLIPAIASPVAPAAATATVLLGAISTGGCDLALM